MSCEVYRELLPAYLDDSLDEVRRTGFRSHLRSCAECRGLALETDPTLVFSLSRPGDPAPERVEACVTSVVAAVRREKLERRLRPSGRRWLAAAAVVVLTLFAATAWWLKAGRPGDAPAISADAHEVEVPNQGAVEGIPVAVEPPPRVEVETTEQEVRVYQYAIGDDGSTGAVFIVNPALEL
jgi:predicted anti-sigma-YlaC factor YlaD